jgi:hypothetical protein
MTELTKGFGTTRIHPKVICKQQAISTEIAYKDLSDKKI